MGIMDIEQARSQNLNSGQLFGTWKLLVTFSLITYLLLLIPPIAMLSIIASLIIGIYYLYVFFMTHYSFCVSQSL